MAYNWLKTRQTKYTAYAATYVIVVVAVLAAINFLANRYSKTYDATSNKQYSLSDQTLKVVKGLKGDVSITYFDDATRFPAAKDLLGRYADLSNKLKVDYVDPVKKPQIARAAGFRRDTPILVANGDRKEEAKSLSEEEVTGAIIRSLKTGVRTACFVSGSGEHGIDDSGRSGYASAKAALERNNYRTRTISLLQAGQAAAAAAPEGGAAPVAAGKPEVPKDCTVLVVGGPRYSYVQPAAEAVKAYVEGGGHALLMLDPPLRLGRDDTQESESLVALLQGWGVTLNKDLALDTSGIGQIFGLGPEVPLVASYEPHVIVSPLKDVATAFPLTRTLEVKSGDKTTVERLFTTSGNSYATSDLASTRLTIDPKKDKKGPFTLAAAGTYNGSTAGRFVVVGSSMWLNNSFIKFNGNQDLFLNMINWLTADEDLISIRPKQAEERPLNLSPQKLNTVFWLSIVVFPLAVVGFGAATWWKRR